MNPVELALKQLAAAQTQKERGTSEVFVPKDQIKKVELPENKFEHFEIHPAMKNFWKTKIQTTHNRSTRSHKPPRNHKLWKIRKNKISQSEKKGNVTEANRKIRS